MELNHEQIAEQFDIINEACGVLANAFRNAAGGSKGAAANGGAKRSSRATDAAPAKGAAAKSKKAAAQDEDLTIDDVREVLKALVDAKGKEVMVQALESVGAGKLADVDESQYGELVTEAKRLMEEDEPEEAPAPKRTRSKAKKAGPTADDLKEKFKELVESDRDAAKAVLKGLGVARISEVDDDDIGDALKAIEAALEGGDDDDDLIG